MVSTAESLGLLGLLGAAHGVNPAMGWLFAVGLGMQEGSRRAVWRALGPMALGHALAIAAVVTLASALGLVVPAGWLRWAGAALLAGMGVLHLLGHRHVRWGGMRVGPRDLVAWSFLVSSAHGAGLMVLPFLVGRGEGDHAGHLLATGGAHLGPSGGLAATVVHTGGYLLATGVIAVLVYEKLGLRLLRTAWLNLDLLWAALLIATGVMTAVL